VRCRCVTVAAIGILALAFSGCGESDDGNISKQGFARQANAICLSSNKEAAAEIQQAFKRPEFAQAKSAKEVVQIEASHLVPILINEAEAQHKGINNLEVPSGEEEQIDSTLSAYIVWIKLAKEDPVKIVKTNDIFNQARELAEKSGLKKCGQTPFEVAA
jgi:hypothetical protein